MRYTLIVSTAILATTMARAQPSDKVLAPFLPLQSRGCVFSCWGRTYHFADGLFPAEIRTAGRQVLAGPVRLAGKVGGQPIMWQVTGGKLLGASAVAATWSASAKTSGLNLQARTLVEYDGCLTTDLHLAAADGKTVDRLCLEVPLRPEHARYIHAAKANWADSYSDAVGRPGWKWERRFYPYVWLGDEERGLAWFSETDEPFQLNDRGKAIQVVAEADQVVLRAELVDHPVRWTGSVEWRFGLQATPVKPVPRRLPHFYHGAYYGMETDRRVLDRSLRYPAAGNLKMTVLDFLKSRGVEVVVYHDTWTDQYGMPTTPYGDKLRSLIKACHDRGIKLIVYFGYGLAGTTPPMKTHHDEWTVWPLIPWRGGKPERNFDAGCNRSPLMEFELAGIEKLVHDFDIDGIYMDGTTECFGCINRLHGCGYRRDGQWIPTYPIWRNREFMRRLDAIFRENRKAPLLDQHMSGNMIIPELSFCDSYWDGEQFEGYKFGDQKALELLPLPKFRAEFMGKQWGLRAEFLNYEKRPFTVQECLAFVLPHDMYVRAAGLGEQLELVSEVWRAFDDFGTDQATWLPYWEQKAAVPQPAGVYCSAYTRPGKGAFLVVSNLTQKPVAAQITLDRKQLNLAPEMKEAWEARSGQRFLFSGDNLHLRLGSMECALVRLGNR